jgi:hypothetical protein
VSVLFVFFVPFNEICMPQMYGPRLPKWDACHRRVIAALQARGDGLSPAVFGVMAASLFVQAGLLFRDALDTWPPCDRHSGCAARNISTPPSNASSRWSCSTGSFGNIMSGMTAWGPAK